MLVKEYDELAVLLKESLTIQPNSKKGSLPLFHTSRQDGWVQKTVIDSSDIVLDNFTKAGKPGGRQTTTECIIFDINNREKQLELIHNKSQLVVREIVDSIKNVIKKYPDKYQAELSRETFSTRDYHSYVFQNFAVMMEDQGIIEKEKRGTSHTYYKLIEDKDYESCTYYTPKHASKLEARMAEVLTRLDIPFTQQVTFPDLKYKGLLRIDFCVELEEGLKYVEVDGRQHYEHVPFFHKTVEEFERAQKRDNIKDMYAKDNELDFLRIRYDDNIEKIVKTWVK